MPFLPNNRCSSGRPKGSKNALPSRKEIVSLIDTIIADLTTNYELLSTQEKLQLLNCFKSLYHSDYSITTEEVFPDNEIRVNIIQSHE